MQKSTPVDEVEDEMKGDEIEEGRAITGQKAIYQPTKEEWDNHMRSHIPFRKWCSFCVKGKCKSGAHKRVKKSDEEIDKEVPVISIDYMGPKSKDQKSEKIDSLPILIGIDRKSKWLFAHMVPKKGHDAHAIKIMSREIRLSGYTSMILKSDQEPAILALLEGAKNERAEAIKLEPL